MKFFITRNVALVGLVTMMFGACANMAHKGGDDMAGPPVRASRSGGSSRDGKLAGAQ